MPVCQYFLSGRCRYGENCRFEHPRGGAQRNLFGGGDQNWQDREGPKVTFRDNYSVSGQSQSNPYKWSSNSHQGQGSSNQPSSIDVLDDLPKSMEIWEKSKMWPFSCLSLDANIPSIPEFYDMSMEELRWDAYQALKTDTMQSYVKKYQTLQNEFANKRNQLKHLTMDMKRKLMSFLEDARKNIAARAGSTVSFSFQSALTQSTLFGQSRPAQESGLFSQPSTSSGLFGKPGGTGPQPTASSGLFGKPAGTGSIFGGNTLAPDSPFGSKASGFGNQSQTAFGNHGTASSVFGNINVQNSLFGGASSNSGFSKSGTSNSAFGSPGTSLFGKPVEQRSIFGDQMAESSNPFGAVNQTSSLQTPSLFGGDSSTQVGLFGSGPQQQSSNPVGGSFNGPVSMAPGLFGKSAASPNASSLFGNNTNGQQQTLGMFASSTNTSFFNSGPNTGQQMGTLFGNQQAENAINQGGHQNSGGLFGKGPSAPPYATAMAANDAFSGCYTLMSDLTDQEKEAFNAQSFQLGKIPLRPPSIELIRNK